MRLRTFPRLWFIALLAISLSRIVIADDGGFSRTLQIGGGEISIVAAKSLPLPPADVEDWVQRAASALTHFYSRFPVKYVQITISPATHGRVQNGFEIGGDRISIRLGSQTTKADLRDDWTLTHEMFHLSQPDLDDEYSWMSEGMADYLEPVARVEVGQINPQRFWKDLVEGLPQGLPEPGDRGLNHTHTWGRTYWGGSLFWLLADIRIREQTHNQKSVKDAAIAVLNSGGDGSREWPLNKLLTTYDAGTGTHVFRDLHDEMGVKTENTDLDALWKSLGVALVKGHIEFDENAPLSAIRRQITAP